MSLITNIEYTNTKDEHSERVIIPVKMPVENMKALDVTGLSSEEQTSLDGAVAEYLEYHATQMSRIFTLDEWMEQTHPEITTPLKWRSFSLKRTTFTPS